MLCAEFLYKNQSSGESFQARLDKLLKAFEQIRDITNPNQTYMDVMKRWPCSAKHDNEAQ
jgi:hypothetical protein